MSQTTPLDPVLASPRPWRWVPSLYFAEGIPYVVVMTVSTLLYKRLGVSNSDLALYTSWLYLPWVIKPLWSPLVEVLGTRRNWITALQFVMGVTLALVALAIPMQRFFQLTLAMFWLMAFASATHDIAADGFYMLGLPPTSQAAFVGIRSTFYRLAMIAGQGLLVVVAGQLEERLGAIALAWALTFGLLALLLCALAAWHHVALPRPASDKPAPRQSPGSAVGEVFRTFMAKPQFAVTVAFLLLYRLGEAQLVKMVGPFLLDTRAKGGLELSTSEVGVVYGTVGVGALVAGGLIGGWVISQAGLKKWLWPMVFAIHIPDLAFVFLSQLQPTSRVIITAAVATEQFGYGFGFTAYTVYMLFVSDGPHRTAHYAFCTGIMALGMMVPGMISGALQEWLGYPMFFLWIVASTLPGFVVPALVRVPEDFARKGAVV